MSLSGLAKVVYRAVVGALWFVLVRGRLFFILVPMYCKIIENYSKKYRNSSVTNAPVVLALHMELFRGDLEELSERGDFQIFAMPQCWQSRIVSQFYPVGTTTIEYYNSDNFPCVAKSKKKCEKFMEGFLKRLYKKLPVKIVILPNVRYLNDLDWARVSKMLGVAYVLLFREGLIMSEKDFHAPVRRHKKFGEFEGSHIIVHNQASKDMFLRTKFIDENKISICGVLRMDKFFRDINNNKASCKKQVTWFYFGEDHDCLGPQDPFRVHDSVFDQFIAMAKENSDVRFVIKPKLKKLNRNGIKHIERAYKRNSIDESTLPNLKIMPNADVHELILDSKVIVGLKSTTVFEAMIAKKNIVVPHFESLRNSEYSDYFGLRDRRDLFFIADDPAHFKKLVIECLNKEGITKKMMSEREAIFEKYISPLDGSAYGRYKQVLKQFI